MDRRAVGPREGRQVGRAMGIGWLGQTMMWTWTETSPLNAGHVGDLTCIPFKQLLAT